MVGGAETSNIAAPPAIARLAAQNATETVAERQPHYLVD